MAQGKLTPKQALFVQEYLVDLNATQAAIRAGYSKKSAHVYGSQTLANPSVARAIEVAQTERKNRLNITEDYVLALLKETAERCLQRVPVMEFDYEERCMVQKANADGEGVWEFDSGGVNKAAELMGKHLGMFKDKVEHSGGALDLIRGFLNGD